MLYFGGRLTYFMYLVLEGLMTNGDYVNENGRISQPGYGAGALVNREMFVRLLTRVLPKTAFEGINDISFVAGYDESGEQYENALLLYRAGVLTGTGGDGSFSPYRTISRAEIAALVQRISAPEMRKRFWPKEAESEFESVLLGIPAQALRVTGFDGEFLYVERAEDGKLCVLGLDGREIIPWQQHEVQRASDGVFRCNADNREGHIYYTTEGERINDTPMYGSRFNEGYAALMLPGDDESIYLMDRRGELRLLTKGYESYFNDCYPAGGYLAARDKKTGAPVFLRLSDGRAFEMGEYTEISNFYDGISVANAGAAGRQLLDTSLRPLLTEGEMGLQANLGEGYFLSERAGAYGVLTTDGVWRGIEGRASSVNCFGQTVIRGENGARLYDIERDETVLSLPKSEAVSFDLCGRLLLQSRGGETEYVDGTPIGESEHRLLDLGGNLITPYTKEIFIPMAPDAESAVYLLEGKYYLLKRAG